MFDTIQDAACMGEYKVAPTDFVEHMVKSYKPFMPSFATIQEPANCCGPAKAVRPLVAAPAATFSPRSSLRPVCIEAVHRGPHRRHVALFDHLFYYSHHRDPLGTKPGRSSGHRVNLTRLFETCRLAIS
jgi:hypothetical protein